ncbi:MAG: M23 family metallopeptidase [Candidatus Levybacteria bacterium]|nr:M23 family metallopeptidase [Candidatus Levybacteria bacterium]
MGKFKYVFITLLLLVPLFLISVNQTHAQIGQIWETIVGNPPDPNEEPPPDPDPGGGSGGGDDGLGPGEFVPPFRCRHKFHGSTYRGHTPYAVDFFRIDAATRGSPVRASADGTVRLIVWSNGQVNISHDGDFETAYAHMRDISVRERTRVRVGQKIGEMSDVGNATSPHLHAGHYHRGRETKIVYNGNPYSSSVFSFAGPGYLWGPIINGHCP